MRAIRLSKAVLTAGIALTCTLVVLDNLVAPEMNLPFVRHVLAMDTVFPDAPIRGRAVTDPGLQQAAFWLIIVGEGLTALSCWIGAGMMLVRLRAPPGRFTAAKTWAVAGLSLGFLVWQAGFLGIAGEWFGMWMSPRWNATESAFRLAILVLGVLIYVALPEPEP